MCTFVNSCQNNCGRNRNSPHVTCCQACQSTPGTHTHQCNQRNHIAQKVTNQVPTMPQSEGYLHPEVPHLATFPQYIVLDCVPPARSALLDKCPLWYYLTAIQQQLSELPNYLPPRMGSILS